MNALLERLGALGRPDPALTRLAAGLDVTFLLRSGADEALIDIRRGVVERAVAGPFVMPSWTFALSAQPGEWEAFWAPRPAPGHHDLFAMIKRRALRVDGDLHPFMAH